MMNHAECGGQSKGLYSSDLKRNEKRDIIIRINLLGTRLEKGVEQRWVITRKKRGSSLGIRRECFPDELGEYNFKIRIAKLGFPILIPHEKNKGHSTGERNKARRGERIQSVKEWGRGILLQDV